ncbi:sensor histidine kinase [Paenibacillus lentus]|uniref:histidine kinase n=1 Tax=Paenibacillus lentus TaxID=1338368 RepID=A0A3Q8S9W9_9BACL|nr:sensor histidine kinase [Paenibacillus lentus]AZK45705.1 sensor histidine kinase [Paenibacillus lentus]
MIRKYLIERRSWILLVIALQLLTLSIAYIDPEIQLRSVLYIVFLSTMIFVIFLVVRYHQETRFYKHLEEWKPHLDVSDLAEGHRPFERITHTLLLEQTKELKEEAAHNRNMLEEEKDYLLSWIHEVKTPLTAMHLMLERLDDETLKTQLTYEWLRIHLLLDQQLHQKRIPSIENDLYIERLNLKSILFAEIRTLRSWCMQKGLGFEVDLQETEVLSDAKWLAFILRQLLTNAVKYSESGDINVKSYTRGDHIVLEIQDQGRGIDSRDLPRIFDKGFTSTTRHHEEKATGMGLYLAHKAAQPLHILMNITSKPRTGTTAILTFPQQNAFVQIQGE